MLERQIYRLVGQPPASGARCEEQLRWVRRFYRLNVVAIALVIAVALFSGDAFFWILAGVIVVVWAGGVASISVQIRRARTRGL